MEWMMLFVIAIGLALDAFAVSLGVGASPNISPLRRNLRVAFHLGLFQGMMAFVGGVVGAKVAPLIQGFDHWIALGLLAFIGFRMIRSGFNPEKGRQVVDLSRGMNLIMICIATSIDALVVGMSLSLLGGGILYPSLVIGLVTFLLSLIGILFGSQMGERFGKPVEIFGGLLLNGIGLRIFLSHII
jgi:manganese efflux pump family protein